MGTHPIFESDLSNRMLQQVTKQVLVNSARTACYGGRHTITLIPGEGIGPEMFGQVRRTVDIMGLPINFEEINVKGTDDLTEAMNSIQRNGVCLKGNIVTQWPIHKSRNLLLRHDLDLYANVVHAKSFDSIDTRHKNIDIVVIRENTEGEYSAMSHQAVPGVVESLKVCTRTNTERIAEYAFQYATKWGRKRVTCVHKANIMKKGDGLFRKVCAEDAQISNITTSLLITAQCNLSLDHINSTLWLCQTFTETLSLTCSVVLLVVQVSSMAVTSTKTWLFLNKPLVIQVVRSPAKTSLTQLLI